VKARVISLGQITEDDESRWIDLLARAVDPYPLIDPRLLIASARHRASAREMQLLLVEDDDTLFAVMPFLPRVTDGRLSLSVVTTRTLFFQEDSVWDHPLIDADRAAEALAAILIELRSRRMPDLVEFFSLPADGVLETALATAAAQLGATYIERERREFTYALRPTGSSENAAEPTADRDPGMPSLGLAHTSSHTRRNYARLARRLVESVGFELRIADRSNDPRAIDDFIELQNSGWKGDPERGGVGLRALGREDWFREVTDRYRADGDLIVYALTAGEELVHMAVNLRIGHVVFAWIDSFNERFTPFKGGSLGRIANINRVFDDPRVLVLDPGIHRRDAAANEFFPDRGERLTILVANGGARAHALVRILPSAQKLRQRVDGLRRRGDQG
jgi:hypothetical protein